MISSLLGQQTVGRFEIRDFLGRGAIGDVYLAWDPRGQREVALKVVHIGRTDPEMLEAEKSGLALQEQLARVAPQVAAIYEQDQDGRLFWVVMEYIAGTDLSQILAGGPLPEDRAIDVALQLVSMLEVVHEFSAEINGRPILGIVHGDIKPQNIRLQEDGRVRVLDFGIAKHLSLTRRFTVNLFGSLPYTSPERLERGVVDRHSDLWAVGVVLATMVSGGRCPFPGRTPEEIEQSIRGGAPPLPLPPGTSPGLAHIVDRCLAFEVAHRYPTAAALAVDLLALRAGLPLPSAGVAAADLHSTRRTSRPLGPEEIQAAGQTRRTGFAAAGQVAEQTRRTGDLGSAPPASPAVDPGVPAGGAPGSSAWPASVPSAIPAIFPTPTTPTTPANTGRPRRSRWKWALLLVLALGVSGCQLWVWREGQGIRRGLSEPHPDLPALAERYANASRFSILGPGLSAVRQDLLGSLSAAAGRVLDSYHGDDPTTTQKGWQTAYDHLQSAARIAPGDRAIRARMLYAHAHLDRIESFRLRADRKRSLELSQQAVTEFREAARWDSGWPDPYLGLARIYAYDMFNLEELQKALGELGRRGYPVGRREQAMLADSFRMQGLGLEARALRAHGTEPEGGLLRQARDDLRQAVHIYAAIPGYGDAAINRDQAEAHLESIESRLSGTHQPGFWEQLGTALLREIRKPKRAGDAG
ncbi:MAG: serine/threonine protein kinase [Acidobacteriota bacterium]|nr:serine/threonine protein kinase [Acidobacteriota bacterium]